MTGPEHYTRAEVLIDLANAGGAEGWDTPRSREQLAAAQVHATLALAAATALNSPPGSMYRVDAREWELRASLVGDKYADE